ncbi:hypothetical protein [Edaphobacter dinghuensis]|uniref:Uncharacterized protein n=1 Tax=Edaphobacter dinghuensis TaxID=1560005 RepID=A0A917HN61_9BACT|nr:hypothetical protein [Edaphobacter dinghuensis]GGG85015.1 hypothetical protein GCM10011585_31040 [Edaphobacter dinghuensis]
MPGFRILQVSSTQLVIKDPPSYLFAAFFIVVAVIGLFVLGGSLAARTRSNAGSVQFEGKTYSQRDLSRGWAVPVVGLLLLLGAGYASWFILQGASLTLDRGTGTYVMDHGRPFFMSFRDTGQLSDIEDATIETDTGGNRFVLVLRDGQRLGLGSFTDQGGQSEAAAAVKHFLRGEN